ncbi:MAG: A24 family peptidase [Candidatus Anstonellaceae archaeon]
MLELFQPPMHLPGIEARIVLVLAFTAVAAYYDAFNKKWVPSTLLYAFLISAFAINLVFFQTSIFIQAVAFGLAAFAISYPLYKTGQLGGADVYAYSAIAMAIPYLPQPIFSPAQNVPYPFILSALAPTGIVFIAHMLVRFFPYIAKRLKHEIKMDAQRLAPAAVVALAFLFFIYSISQSPAQIPLPYLAILSFLFSSLLFFSIFKQEIKDSMVETIPISKAQPEDVLAIEKLDPKVVSSLRLSPVLDSQAISAMRKAKINKVPIYTKMPFFLPYLFFGVLFTILFGDLAFLILRSF